MAGLHNLFVCPVTLFGYGTLEQISAGYVFKYMNRGNFITIMQRCVVAVIRKTLAHLRLRYNPGKKYPARLPKGYQSFIEAMELAFVKRGGQVLKSTNVTRITRTDGLITVQAEVSGGDKGGDRKMEFDHVIIAFPQLPQSMKILQLSPAEKEVFEHVQRKNYHTIAFKDKGQDEKTQFPTGAVCAVFDSGKVVKNPNDGIPSFVLALGHTPTCVSYAIHDDDKFSKEDFETTAKKFLIEKHKFMLHPEPVCSKNWEYFPHFKSEQFVEKHNQLFPLQGQWNTYYTGGLLCFEDVERCVEYSKFLTEEFI